MSETISAPPAAPPTPAATTRPRAGLSRWAGAGPTYGALAALVVLVVVNALFTPNFATTSNLWNILLQVSTVLLVAVGMTLVIATGGIDLSVGSVMAVEIGRASCRERVKVAWGGGRVEERERAIS